jgi:dihydroorotase
MKRIYIHNAKIVSDGKVVYGGIVIRDDTIEQVLSNLSMPNNSCDDVIDAQGGYILPGVIDEHVHFREPGLTTKGDIHSESIAAAAGGVTSIMDMPNTKPQTITLEAFDDKMRRMAESCVVNYSCYFGASNDNTSLLRQLDPHRVCGIKVFMGASTGNMLVNKLLALYDIFSIKNILVAVHCEDQDIINANIEKYRSEIVDGDLPLSYHNKIRTSVACFTSSTVAFRLARRLGTQLHILHVSTLQELRLFSDKKQGKRITGEVCVGYLNFSSSDYKKLGALIKVNPAMKTPNVRDELFRAIKDGRIDTIATDHAPHLLSEKQGGALKARSGMPSIQFSLLSMLQCVTKQLFDITMVVEKMCHAPARIYQIHDRGFIREGYKADLVLVKEGLMRTITDSDVLSKCRWTPFNGFDTSWYICNTFVNGQMVYDGHSVNEAIRGEELSFR